MAGGGTRGATGSDHSRSTVLRGSSCNCVGSRTGQLLRSPLQLLRSLSRSTALLDNAWRRTALGAVNGGVPLEEVARWAGMPAETLRSMLTAGGQEDCSHER